MTKLGLLSSMLLLALAHPASASDLCVDTQAYTCQRLSTTQISRGHAMSSPNTDNLVFIPRNASPSPKVLVFLPGTGDPPDNYEGFLAAAANHGYVVIGLAYRNSVHSPDLCGWFPNCASSLYDQNVIGDDNGFYADDAVTKSITPYHNSLNFRFRGLLDQLNLSNPGVDWDGLWDTSAAYTTNTGFAMSGEPAWWKMIVAGHSQGGEHATWILRHKSALAGLTFEAPYATLNDCHACDHPDPTPNGSPRHWVTGESVATSTSNVTHWSQSPTANPNGSTFGSDLLFANFVLGWHPNNLLITLDTHDPGYDPADDGTGATVPNRWPGHNMHGVGKQLIGFDPDPFDTPITSVPNHIYALTTPVKCGGHSDTIVYGCTPDWMDTYYEALFDEADTFLPAK